MMDFVFRLLLQVSKHIYFKSRCKIDIVSIYFWIISGSNIYFQFNLNSLFYKRQNQVEEQEDLICTQIHWAPFQFDNKEVFISVLNIMLCINEQIHIIVTAFCGESDRIMIELNESTEWRKFSNKNRIIKPNCIMKTDTLHLSWFLK
jgi:hypothetical protein